MPHRAALVSGTFFALAAGGSWWFHVSSSKAESLRLTDTAARYIEKGQPDDARQMLIVARNLDPDNIRANAINPAIADTPLLTTFMGGADTPENRAKFTASIPLGRLGRSTDVANAAVFFADPASEFVTGVCMEVDGGRCI